RGVRMREYTFSTASVGKLASTLFQLLREHAIELPNDEALLDELRNVRLKETSPGVVRLDHDAGGHDDRAIALALASHRLVERGEPRAPHGSWWADGEIPGIVPMGAGVLDGADW